MPREVMAEGRWLRMIRQNGWEWVERRSSTGVVVIAALTESGEVLLVEQFRQPLGCRVIELPAGLAGDGAAREDESLVDAARRELLEETGYEAPEFEKMTEGPVSAGMSSETVTFFRALQAHRTGPGGGEDDEDIEVHVIPLDEVEDWISRRAQDGIPADPKVYAGLHFLRAATRT